MKTGTLDWQLFQKQLRAFVRKRVPAQAVDDITGDVILRLVANKDKLTATEKPLAWMYTVTSHVIADYYRHHAHEKETIEHGVVDTDNQAEAADTATAADELADCIMPLIRNLPEPYRKALLMTEIEGMKQTDAAKKLELSESGMKSRVQRGRARLKDAILACCQVSVNRKGNILDYEAGKTCC